MSGAISRQEGSQGSSLFCKPGQIPKFHLFIGYFHNIEFLLQTEFHQTFPDAGLDAVLLGGVGIFLSVVFPESGMILLPIPLIIKAGLAIVFFPAFLTEEILFSFAITGTA